MEAQDLQFIPLNAWQDTLLDLTDIVEGQKQHYLENVLASMHLYNSKTKQRAYYGVPMKTFATPFHIWGNLIEKAGFKTADMPQDVGRFHRVFQAGAGRASQARHAEYLCDRPRGQHDRRRSTRLTPSRWPMAARTWSRRTVIPRQRATGARSALKDARYSQCAI